MGFCFWTLNSFLFQLGPPHMEIPGPGIELMSQQCARPLQRQCRVLNPLCFNGTPSQFYSMDHYIYPYASATLFLITVVLKYWKRNTKWCDSNYILFQFFFVLFQNLQIFCCCYGYFVFSFLFFFK